MHQVAVDVLKYPLNLQCVRNPSAKTLYTGVMCMQIDSIMKYSLARSTFRFIYLKPKAHGLGRVVCYPPDSSYLGCQIRG